MHGCLLIEERDYIFQYPLSLVEPVLHQTFECPQSVLWVLVVCVCIYVWVHVCVCVFVCM